MIVVDASAAVSWLLSEKTASNSLGEIFVTRQIIVPAHWTVEIGHAILKALRRKAVMKQHLIEIGANLELLDIRVEPPMKMSSITPMISFARQHGLTMYDAAYVQLALAQSAELATFDSAMRNAASQLGVALFPP